MIDFKYLKYGFISGVVVQTTLFLFGSPTVNKIYNKIINL